MRTLHTLLVVATLAWSCSLPAQPVGPALSVAPAMPPAPLAPVPVCTEIDGPANLVLSYDGGKTLVQSKTPRREDVEVLGVVSLGVPFALAALIGWDSGDSRELFVSVDGGCHWTTRGKTEARSLAEGRDGVAYACGSKNYVITTDSIQALSSLPYAVTVVADPENRVHLRALGSESILDSVNGGETWQTMGEVGTLRGSPSVAIAGKGLDAILLVGLRGDPQAHVSRDGGRTWRTSTGPVSPETVWVAPNGDVAWAFGQQFFRSTDGGATFIKVAEIAPLALEAGAWGAAGVLLGAQPNGDMFIFAGRDERVPSRFLLTFDTRSLQWTRQPLPIDPGRRPVRPLEAHGVSEAVAAGTFVPGAPSVLCLGIDKEPPWRNLE